MLWQHSLHFTLCRRGPPQSWSREHHISLSVLPSNLSPLCAHRVACSAIRSGHFRKLAPQDCERTLMFSLQYTAARAARNLAASDGGHAYARLHTGISLHCPSRVPRFLPVPRLRGCADRIHVCISPRHALDHRPSSSSVNAILCYSTTPGTIRHLLHK